MWVTPFDRSHMNSYQCFIVTICTLCIVSEIQSDIGWKILFKPNLYFLPHLSCWKVRMHKMQSINMKCKNASWCKPVCCAKLSETDWGMMPNWSDTCCWSYTNRWWQKTIGCPSQPVASMHLFPACFTQNTIIHRTSIHNYILQSTQNSDLTL